ncbi:hypothetical protein SASPL_109039 [Salvia splendens]|uniref:Solute carrier family 15 (Peptide/histidine transporter), member 3/4 n=1 Tax=Salvia splendens TaxID=180675 RepID=A0A8X8YDF3_SALSN|nr:hypothetical protein SASPL_109039 [Salvia splendens]
MTFAADQLEMSKEKTESRSWNFFNWYYFCMATASLLAATVVVYIQEHVSWGWGLGIPTAAMAISLIAFLLGSSMYKKIKPGGSPYVRVVQVITAAIKKRRVPVPAPTTLYENRHLDAPISTDGRLLHSNQLKWLDRAAVVVGSESESVSKPNLWRLATVHRVEEVKSMIRLLPIWGAGILHVASHSHLGSFTIVQARSMNRHLSPSFEIPPASMSIFSTLTVLSCLPLYERLFVPLARRFTANPTGLICLQRMGVGFGINILATIVSALIEMKRKSAAADHNLLDKPNCNNPHHSFLASPAVLPAWIGRGVHVRCPHGVLLRPVTREHEELCSSPVLDRHRDRELHGHPHGDAGAQIHREIRELAA